ncbi:MAG: formylglycine-generating enzyme family protein [Desulfobacteraceae bacterium]|nr:MAG: formylglycine-generating enzyme family protein [Desulfobacteraceae bacterium]
MKSRLLLSLALHCVLLLPANAYPQNPGNAFSNSIGLSLIYIPAGTFLMGSPVTEPGRGDDETQHHVTISKGFYISTAEISQEQFQTIMGYNPSAYQNLGKNYPVEQVSWNECQVFIEKLNQKEKTRKYRLPTEAEWEYACRAGTNKAFASGEIVHTDCRIFETLDKIGWYCGNSDFQPHQIARKKPNPWGLFDMHGNVQEWCLDHSTGMSAWSRRANADTDTYVDNIVDPLSRKGERRIFRGGSWNQSSKYARSANRSYYRPTAKRNDLGFRIVKEK